MNKLGGSKKYILCIYFRHLIVFSSEVHEFFSSEVHVPKTNRVGESIEDMTMVHKISTEKKIYIPHSVKPQLLELITQQSDQWDDGHLQHDIEQRS